MKHELLQFKRTFGGNKVILLNVTGVDCIHKNLFALA